MKYENEELQSCYDAGKDAAINGSDVSNASFRFFRTKEMKDAWQKGYDEHRRSL